MKVHPKLLKLREQIVSATSKMAPRPYSLRGWRELHRLSHAGSNCATARCHSPNQPRFVAPERRKLQFPAS